MQSRPSMVTLTSRGKSSQFTFLERSMMAVLSRGKHVLVRFTRVTNTLRSTSISAACCTLLHASGPHVFLHNMLFLLMWHRFNRSCPVIHAHKRNSIHRISIFGVKLFWREIFFLGRGEGGLDQGRKKRGGWGVGGVGRVKHLFYRIHCFKIFILMEMEIILLNIIGYL